MYDYGTARHARQKKTKRTESTSKSVERKSVDARTFVQKLRFFLCVLVGIVLFLYLLVTKVLPNMIPIGEPVNMVIHNSRGTTDATVYFLHVNPDEQLQFAAVLPSDQEIKQPFSSHVSSLAEISRELADSNNLPAIKATYSHMFGVLVTSYVQTNQEKNSATTGELFSYALDPQEKISLHERLEAVKYWLYMQKHAQTIRQLTTIEELKQHISDNQAVWRKQNTKACPIAVVNTTRVQGLAQVYSSILEESGGFIIRVTSDSTLKDKSVLYTTESESCSGLQEDIMSLFPAGVQVESNQPVTDEYRAGIVLHLGQDSAP